ncbi:5-carboxymethyl-2-hydroxymuconate Delta-isomerase [Shouchella patagoniensis]|uniref:5-carboxymethyl-2-hydroxymuconate Delta-isomerase n=1 Tax=Shouchella patagoniensis TaxID=228576 RepID=UPI000994BB37|nr:5-carboxymethyl-2-hydroxymuconate Delta-isomerase [Shouchella patagoniensis]
MPHIIVEYTRNLDTIIQFDQLLPALHSVLLKQPDVFPIGGIRSRAIPLDHFYIADGSRKDDAFVHLTLKIGAGRSMAEKQHTCSELFDVLVDYFRDEFNKRGLALSLELSEFSKGGTLKKNSIHTRYK